MKKDVIGFGAINLDLIYEVKDKKIIEEFRNYETHISEKEFNSLKKFLAQKAELKSKSAGGSAANTVYALAKMEFKTGYIGKVGKDKEGKFLLKNFNPVDTSGICFDEKSGTTLILISNRDRLILVLPNSNDTLRYEEIDLDYAGNTKFLHLTSFIGNLPFQAQVKLVKEMYERSVRSGEERCLLSFDPGQCYAQRGLKALLPIIRHTEVIFPSEGEIKSLTGKNYREGSQELLNYGAKIVACTRGVEGSYVISKNEEYEIPADPEIKPVDPTGAGDVYAAGFLAGLLLNLPLKKCGQLATKLAEISITGYGREKYPTKESLEEAIKRRGMIF